MRPPSVFIAQLQGPSGQGRRLGELAFSESQSEPISPGVARAMGHTLQLVDQRIGLSAATKAVQQMCRRFDSPRVRRFQLHGAQGFGERAAKLQLFFEQVGELLPYFTVIRIECGGAIEPLQPALVP